MKIFFYKSILVLFLFLVGFHYSFNYVFKIFKTNIEQNFSRENIEQIKNKIKEEMEVAINKDVFISEEDSNLINKFLDKISSDLNKK